MKCIFVRNVKLSAAECNSFNMRKKNVEYLASKKFVGGSNAKKQTSGCKITTISVQSCNFRSVKLQTSKCNSKYFQLQPDVSSHHQHPAPRQATSTKNCIIIQFECIFMQFLAFISPPFVKNKT